MKKLKIFLLGFLFTLSLFAQTIRIDLPYTDPIDDTDTPTQMDVLIYDLNTSSTIPWLIIDQNAVNKTVDETNNIITMTSISVTAGQSYVFTFTFRDQDNAESSGGQSVAVNYTAPGGGDTTPPTLTTAVIENTAASNVVMTFSEPVNGTNLGFTIAGTTSTTFSSLTGLGNGTVTGILATPAAQGETITLSYSSTTGDLSDLASNDLATFSNTSVTNNVSASYPNNNYTQNTTAGADGWSGGNTTVDGNIDAIGGRDNVLRGYANTVNTAHTILRNALVNGAATRLRFDYFIPPGNTSVDGLLVNDSFTTIYQIRTAGSPDETTVTGTWTSVEILFTAASGSLRFQLVDGAGSSLVGVDSTTDDVVYFTNITVDYQ